MKLASLLSIFGLIFTVSGGCPFASSTLKDNKHEINVKNDNQTCPHKLLSELKYKDPFGNTIVTQKGCSCKTNCAASLYENLANCDWCYTHGDCGIASINGYYDYCTYPTNQAYEAQSGSDKLAALWNQITSTPGNGAYPNVLEILDESINTSFDDNWDVFPPGRTKDIHSMGATCQFNLIVNDASPYTGVFAPGTKAQGLVRLGSAQPVSTSSGVIPGLGIKFMRDGVKSANFVALVTLSPLPGSSYNFFQSNFSNIIPPAAGFTAVLAKKFEQASTCPNMVGLSDICSYGVNGSTVSNVVFPYRVKLFSSNVQFPTKAVDQSTMQSMLGSIPVGTSLFDVYAFASPLDDQNDNGILLGSMVTTSECLNSKFGDNSLFFRHQRVEDDWQLQPEWLNQMDPQATCGLSKLTTNPPAYCPSHLN